MDHLDNAEKRKLFSLFHNIQKPTVSTGLDKSQNSDILLIDALNTYLRAFSANPQLNDNGMHTGGISGFLKSIGAAIRLLRPTRCITVFDGIGGCSRRKKLFSEYKNHRANKVRLNRIFENNSTTESENQALARQLIRTSHYIDNLPLTNLQEDYVEADDVIAFLALDTFKNSNVTIMSTDKDFYQIINDRVKVYSPTKKKIYGPAEVLLEFGISAKNFVLYRTLDGDVSDNIDGIKGCGLKTILKAFPFLAEDIQYGIKDIFEHCEVNRGKFKIYENVFENENLVRRNYDLMQLSTSIITDATQLNIVDKIKHKNKLNRYQLNNMIREDMMWNAIPNALVWIETIFKPLDSIS